MTTKKQILGGGVDVQTSAGTSALVVDESTGAVTAGPISGTSQVSHYLYGYSSAITWGNGTVNISNRNSSNAATIIFANNTTKIGNFACSATYPFSATNSSGSDVIAVHVNGIYGYNPGTMRAVGTTSGNILGDTTISKRDYKDDIEDISYGLIECLKLKPRKFIWKATKESDIGCIADEVATATPSLAYYDKNGVPEGVNYGKLVLVAIKAIQEQQAIIETMKAEIEALKAKVP